MPWTYRSPPPMDRTGRNTFRFGRTWRSSWEIPMTDLLTIARRIYRNPRYIPIELPNGDLQTFCNFGVWDMAESLGCTDLWMPVPPPGRPMLANEIADYVVGRWKELDIPSAIQAATADSFVIAVQKGNPDGHVVTILPGPGDPTSGHWGPGPWPYCVNIGKSCWMTGEGNAIGWGINYAFVSKDNIRYFAWPPSMPTEG